VSVAIAGIPKTIDNDVDYIDRSFGFLSAFEAAQASIRYMNRPQRRRRRQAAFLAATSALGSVDVDAVLSQKLPFFWTVRTAYCPTFTG
jgi:6-phosphofructokinase 1